LPSVHITLPPKQPDTYMLVQNFEKRMNHHAPTFIID